ncbi:MAG: efflux RND transporter permease subunit [Thermoplasmatota archaeon]
MITEKVGSFTTKHPWIGIVLILLITAGSVALMIAKPMEQSFDQEQFMPDMEVARANSEYQDKFTSTYPFLILVRSGDGDMVTKEGFTEMVKLSDRIVEDETYAEWKDSGELGFYPMSPASSMYQMRLSVDFADDISDKASILDSYLPPIGDLSNETDHFLSTLNGTGPADEEDLSDAVLNLSLEMSDFIGYVTEPEEKVVPYSNATQYFQGFPEDKDLKDEIGYLLAFNYTNESIMSSPYVLMGFTPEGMGAYQKLTDALESINETLSGTILSVSSTNELKYLKENASRARERMGSLLDISRSMGNPLALSRMVQQFYFGQFVIVNFLTEDFDPSIGMFSADGAIMNAHLDYSLFDMWDEDPEKLKEIEGNISKVVTDFDEESRLKIHSLPSALIDQRITDASMRTMMILLPIALGLVILILALIYKNIFDTALNIIGLSMAIIWMYGFGSLVGYPSNPMITAVPVLIIGLGIDYGIHLTMRYREEIRKGKTVKESIKAMSGSVGMALLLATFTTVFAFLSNLFSPVGIITQFGVMAAVGILSSFFIMLVFVPSVKKLWDGWKASRGKALFLKFKEGECDLCEKEENNRKLINRMILGMSLRAEKHPALILVIVGLVTTGMLAAALQSEIVFDVNDFLPEGLQESEDLAYVFTNFRLGGSGDLGIIIVEGDVTDPEVLRAMNDTMAMAVEIDSDYISYEGEGAERKPNADFILYSLREHALRKGAQDSSDPFVVLYTTYFDIESGMPFEGTNSQEIKEVYDAYYDNSPSEARRVIYRDGDSYTMTAIAFTVGTENDKEAWELYDELKDVSKPIDSMDEEKVSRVSETGTSIVMAVVISAMQQSQISSLLITIAVSLVVLTIVFFIEEKAIILGTVATLPVVFCVIWIVGTMYLVGIPLNVMTITIGALTVGLGITFGIHITHRFVEDIKVEKDLMEASKNTLINTGSALFGAAATTVAGFALLTLSPMPPLQQFGQVTALAITYSFISSIVVLPVLLILWAKGRKKFRGLRGKAIFNGMNGSSSPDERVN